MTRKYGRKGYTMKKSIRSLLEPCERPSRRKNQTAIDGLGLDELTKLIDALPDGYAFRCADGAPTMAEFIKLGEKIGGIRFRGFRVDPEDEDERIMLTGLAIPAASVDHKVMKRVLDRSADAKLAWTARQGEALLTVDW